MMYQKRFRVVDSLIFLVILTELTVIVSPKIDSREHYKNCPPLKLGNGTNRYRFRGRNVRFSCMRGFQLVGARYASCMNGKWDAKTPVCVKYGCRAPSTSIVNGQFIESYRGAVVKIICNPGYTLVGSPSVYCNGVSWNETFPICKVLNKNPTSSCDFETEDLCGWSQDPMHDFDWIRKSSESSESGNKTLYDRTIGANGIGHYMYIGNSKSKPEEESARIYSPVYLPNYSKDSCFKFWYYFHGRNTGHLKIYVKPQGIEFYDLLPSFWIVGEHGNKWHQGMFKIEPTTATFQIVIEAVRERYATSEAAFDDVEIAFGDNCIVPEVTDTSTEASTTTVSVSDVEEDLYPLSCKNRCNRVLTVDTEDVCQCHNGCSSERNCCSDYEEICILSASSTLEVETETSTLSESVESTTSSSPTEEVTSSQYHHPTPKSFNNETNDLNSKNSTPFVPPKISLKAKTTEKTTSKTTTAKPTEKQTTKPTTKPTKSTTKSTSKSTTKTIQISKTTPMKPLVWKKNVTKNVTKSESTKIFFPGATAKGNKTLPNKKVLSNGNNTVTKTSMPTNKTLPLNKEVKKGLVPLKNFTENETISRKVKIDHKNETISSVTSLKENSADPFNKHRTLNLTFLEKVSIPVLPNDSRFYKHSAIKIQQHDKTTRGSLPEVLSIAGALLAILVVLIVVIALYKRNRSRKSERDNMVEDSDVRFLTSDEVLDFTLARPADDDL